MADNMFAPKTLSTILEEVSMIENFSQKSAKLDFYIRLLEDEKRKIEFSELELPHIMHFIQDAIDRLREESSKWREKWEKLIVEQYMAMMKKKNESLEKRDWLSSAQLGSTSFQNENPDSGSIKHHQLGESSYMGSQAAVQRSSFGSRGGAFVPFRRPNVGIQLREGRPSPPAVPVPRVDGFPLSLANNDVEPAAFNAQENASGLVRPQLQLRGLYRNQQHKKQRRCWSPELHGRFKDALDQLGGPKSATPKAIKELMQVDGLTNDEVKSHLQKFRLYDKRKRASKIPSWMREPPAGTSSSPSGPVIVDLGTDEEENSRASRVQSESRLG